jgi:predicted nuclease of predicted toxin-antitoxin system
VLRLLVDHDFNQRILRGVQSRAEVDVVLARAVNLQDKPDAVLLAWAAAEDRIVLSHDLETMPSFAVVRVRNGETMPGLILIPQDLRIGKAIEELTMIAVCSDQSEWRNTINYVPL